MDRKLTLHIAGISLLLILLLELPITSFGQITEYSQVRARVIERYKAKPLSKGVTQAKAIEAERKLCGKYEVELDSLVREVYDWQDNKCGPTKRECRTQAHNEQSEQGRMLHAELKNILVDRINKINDEWDERGNTANRVDGRDGKTFVSKIEKPLLQPVPKPRWARGALVAKVFGKDTPAQQDHRTGDWLVKWNGGWVKYADLYNAQKGQDKNGVYYISWGGRWVSLGRF